MNGTLDAVLVSILIGTSPGVALGLSVLFNSDKDNLPSLLEKFVISFLIATWLVALLIYATKG